MYPSHKGKEKNAIMKRMNNIKNVELKFLVLYMYIIINMEAKILIIEFRDDESRRQSNKAINIIPNI